MSQSETGWSRGMTQNGPNSTFKWEKTVPGCEICAKDYKFS